MLHEDEIATLNVLDKVIDLCDDLERPDLPGMSIRSVKYKALETKDDVFKIIGERIYEAFLNEADKE